jgi:hypothetical protein
LSLHQNVCLFSIQRNAFAKFLFSSWQITKQLFQNQGNQVWNTRTNTMTVTNPRVLQIKQNRILCSVNVILSRCIFNQNVTITRLLKRTNLCRIRRIESGWTARNPSARISTARHFFSKCQLLDRKISTARIRFNLIRAVK